MRLLAPMTLIAGLLVSSVALAEEKAEEKKEGAAPTAKSIEQNNSDMLGKGSLIIGAERVWGFSSSAARADGEEVSRTTSFGFLWSQPRGVHQMARMGIDYIIIDNVTVGGSLGIAHSKTTIPGKGTVAEQSISSTNLLIAPRVGYLFGGKGVLSFWARLGPSFWNVNGENDTGNWGLALNIEPAIIISPYQHLGIYLGGALDLGLTGKTKGANPVKYTETNWGVNSGLVAWF